MKNFLSPRKCSIFSFIVFAFFKLTAQRGFEPSQMNSYNITVNCDDYTIKTQMLSKHKKIKVNNERVYMWYNSQKIIETKGGFDGKLIHGSYRAFYLNNQLKEKGQIKYGLKNKEWKYWYSDGKLREVINWYKGQKQGSYYLYNDYGQLMAKSNFKRDKLDGNFYTYNETGKILDRKKYKNGAEVLPKIKTKNQKVEKQIKADESINPLLSHHPSDTLEKKTPFLKKFFGKKIKANQPNNIVREEKKKIITS